MADPVSVEIDIQRTWPVDIRRAWDLLSDTETFNALVGMDAAFEDLDAGGPERVRVATQRFMGLALRLEERSYDFELPSWFRIVREVLAPVRLRIEVHCSFAAAAGATAIRYRVRLTPAVALFGPVVRQMAAQTEARFGAAIDALFERAGQTERVKALLPGPPLDQDRRTLLARAASVEPAAFGARLERFLHTAGLDEQERMEPLVLAARWGVDEDVVLDGFIAAVGAGVLRPRLDVLCPACRGPAGALPRLGASADVHCPSCQIRYRRSDPDAVGVSFRPALADVRMRSRCLGSPARTPHVVARERVLPGAPRTWSLDLAPGAWLLRAWGSPELTQIVVEDGRGPRQAVVEVHATALRPARVQPAALRLAAGPVALEVRVWGDRPVEVTLESRWRPPGALTLTRLLTHPGGAALLGVPAGGVGLRPMAVLVVEAFRDQETTLAAVAAALEGAERVLVDARRALAVWPQLGPAVAAARRLQGVHQLCCAVAHGPVVDAGPDLPPLGTAVDAALDALRAAVPGGIAIPPGCAADPRFVAAFGEGAQVLPGLATDPGAAARIVVEVDATLLVASSAGAGAAVAAGDRIRGRYLLRERIGAGAFGEVFLADDEHGRADVVVKLLAARWLDEPDVLQQTFDEARLASRLDHPGVVRVRDFGHTAAGGLFIVMDRAPGVPLSELLEARGRLPVARVEKLARDLLDALAHVHEAGLLHRDLKPANVLVAPDRARLLDFGVAVDLAEHAWDPGAVVAGTLSFMSPEQALNEAQDARSDLYALGLVLFLCLVGRLPTGGLRGGALLRHRLRTPGPPVREVAGPAVPFGLAHAIDRALAIAVDARWASARDMAAALDLAEPPPEADELPTVGIQPVAPYPPVHSEDTVTFDGGLVVLQDE